MPSQLLARVDAAPGDARRYATLAKHPAAAGEVLALVDEELLRPLARVARPARPALDRLDGVHRPLVDLRVADVYASEHYRERYASSVRNNAALQARFAADRRVVAEPLAPLLTSALAESRYVLDQSIRSASSNRSGKTLCRRHHTPASCQSRNLRQPGAPQPIYLESVSQGMPLLRT